MTTHADLIASGLLPASWTPAVATPVAASGGGLDAAVAATAGMVAAVLGCWLLLALGFALAQRATAGRPVATAVLDRCLALVAPGTAGRVLRAAVGLGATGAGLLGPLLATATAEAASPGRPTSPPELAVAGGGATRTAATTATATPSVRHHGVPVDQSGSDVTAPDPVPDAVVTARSRCGRCRGRDPVSRTPGSPRDARTLWSFVGTRCGPSRHDCSPTAARTPRSTLRGATCTPQTEPSSAQIRTSSCPARSSACPPERLTAASGGRRGPGPVRTGVGPAPAAARPTTARPTAASPI